MSPLINLGGDASFCRVASLSHSPGIMADSGRRQAVAVVDDGLCRAVFRALGDASVDSLALVAAISPVVYGTALTQATRGSRPLNEMEKAKLRLTFNAVRVKFGGSPLGTDTATVPAASPSVSPGVSLNPRVKLKLSQVIDQGCDMEVELLSHDGVAEDAEQVCGKLEANMAPFVDIGVWGLYGDRLARAALDGWRVARS